MVEVICAVESQASTTHVGELDELLMTTACGSEINGRLETKIINITQVIIQ
jgi:hypothetical protein